MERQMARKSKPVKTRTEAGEIYTSDPLALNQWCIEMASRWPVWSDHGYAGAIGAMPRPPQQIEADIIGRANRIMAWVKQHH